MQLEHLSTTETHKKFAWLPVVVMDRTTKQIHTVWLEYVNRRLVSVNGALVWAYEPITQ